MPPAATSPQATLPVLIAPCQAIVFALPLAGVQKVIRSPQIFRSGAESLGITPFAGRDAIVLDLHQQLYGSPDPQPAAYVVIVQTRHDRLYGLPTQALPIMRQIPQSDLRPLPPDYRSRDRLGIASHVITLATDRAASDSQNADRSNNHQTLFLLDPDRIFHT